MRATNLLSMNLFRLILPAKTNRKLTTTGMRLQKMAARKAFAAGVRISTAYLGKLTLKTWCYKEVFMIHRGSCLCGKVTFEIEGNFEQFFLCHCERCRKDTGSAHVWCRAFCDGQEGDVCPGNPNNRFGSVHFKPLAPVKNWNAFVCFFSYWGSAAVNHGIPRRRITKRALGNR